MAALVCGGGPAGSGAEGDGIRFIRHDRKRSGARFWSGAVAGGAVSGRGRPAAAAASVQDRGRAWRLLDHIAAFPPAVGGDALVQELASRNDRRTVAEQW